MIEFRNVSKTYDTGTKAVKNANFVPILWIIYQKIIKNEILRSYR